MARPNGSPRVVAWADSQDERRLCISVLSLAEYDKGIANLAVDAPARRRLQASVAAVEARFSGRVLSLSDNVVRTWGHISGTVRRETGVSPPVIDTMLAATALVHDLCLVTRNVRDVIGSGAVIFNPWEDDPAAFALD